jgi:hypothetical protein
MRYGVEKRSLREAALGFAKHRDAEPRKNGCQKRRYDLPSICSMVFSSTRDLILRAILASSSSPCLSSYSRSSLDDACHRSQGVVRGRKPLSDRKLQNEANLGSTPECPREPPLGPPFLLIIRMIFASLVIRLYRLLMFVEAPVSWFLFRRAP